MGITERKEREKKELRKLILATAARLFLEQGYEKTSMRNIAEAIEYSPTTIYLYFKDKNELFYALSEEGFRKFFSYVNNISEELAPMDQLKELGKVYLQFASDHPAYYELMFILKEPMESEQTAESWDLGMKSHGVLTTIVNQCIKEGHFKDQSPDVVAFMIWSFVHGAVSFKICDRMKMYDNLNHDYLINDSLKFMNHLLEKN
ncbi:MAG: TetR/AcrR family transcriptional regulator [Bacteroidota bacterium]